MMVVSVTVTAVMQGVEVLMSEEQRGCGGGMMAGHSGSGGVRSEGGSAWRPRRRAPIRVVARQRWRCEVWWQPTASAGPSSARASQCEVRPNLGR